jgi:hypothetical protein
MSEAEQQTQSDITEMDIKLKKALDEIEKIKEAFPFTDFNRHHTEHELSYQRADYRADLQKKIIEHLAKGFAWVVAVVIGMAIWNHFIAAVKVAI